MAITPRTVFRNPFLMLFFGAFALAGLTFLLTCPGTAPSTSNCGLAKSSAPPPQARVQAVKTVNVATMQAARSAEHGWLGVEIQTLNAERAKWAGIENVDRGVLVLGVQERRPAQLAGFQPYDVIVNFNGKTMGNACQLKKTVAATAPGTKVPVEVIRDGQRLILHPTLTEKDGRLGCGGACR